MKPTEKNKCPARCDTPGTFSVAGEEIRGASPRGLNVRRLFAFWPLGDLEADFLTFLECFEPAHLYGRKVCEQVFAAIVRSNETIALGVIEPLHRTRCHAPLPRFETGRGARDLFEFQDRASAEPVQQHPLKPNTLARSRTFVCGSQAL